MQYVQLYTVQSYSVHHETEEVFMVIDRYSKTFLEYLDQATNCQLQSSRFWMTNADYKIGNLHHLKAKSFKFRYSFVHQFITAGCSTGFLILSIMQSVIYTISSLKLHQMLQSLRLDENCPVSKMELLSLRISTTYFLSLF